MESDQTRDFYYLSVAIPVAGGYTAVGKVFVAYDKQAALDMFNLLKGIPEGEAPGLKLDLIHSALTGTQRQLASCCCSLADACENMKIVFKQTFKSINLE
ncbi:hypothetical protein [Pedobacter sp. SYP-B3415]|uniref:hypothetical protein n=1 Tax=Pedobacter sp. SYP-B3415 TaxID=2496641 RepID=UPI00101BED1E|nr:hypothetical protein [Pedobacter sp. SYP-B3415]